MKLNKKSIAALLAFTFGIPIFFVLGISLIEIINIHSSGDASAGNGIVFLLFMIGIPVIFAIFIAVISIGFVAKLCTKPHGISFILFLLPMMAIIYAFVKAFVATKYSRGIFIDALGVFIAEYPWWLYAGYLFLLLISMINHSNKQGSLTYNKSN